MTIEIFARTVIYILLGIATIITIIQGGKQLFKKKSRDTGHRHQSDLIGRRQKK